ncbi:uncharacterized protein I206_107271 [Kwoniella pini CBS 10737]|uniref:Uncharacterized protein n=1 Tax=Kwoniella pini CBS 10737 TaxID=1296096 RepID=A0A1B9HYQ5_9TREE|nr:uncharacterized protein I206_05184 [Kwoniella pini CBS 10737]OCF48407.1 hypothetical protein I206_05184 [Kwoniella pini CBS 10737]
MKFPTVIILALMYVTFSSAFPIDNPSSLSQETFKGICPNFDVRCVKDGNWRNPIGKLGSKPFCREGLRCNQCEESRNTRECNRTFKECEGECQAYGPIPI